MSKIDPKDVAEWCENEGTRYFLKVLHDMLDRTYETRANVFFPGEPQKTQEGKATLLGMEHVLDDLIQAIEEKDLSQLETQEPEVEQVRYPSVRRPGSH